MFLRSLRAGSGLLFVGLQGCATAPAPAPVASPSVARTHATPSLPCPAGIVLVATDDMKICFDRTEVTVRRYAECVEATACPSPAPGVACNYFDGKRSEHPMNCVPSTDAAAYCAWRGMRLPTVAEHEAAWGTRRFPWGSAASERRACCGRSYAQGTCEVGSTPTGQSRNGALDVAGNVAEWVDDGTGMATRAGGSFLDGLDRLSPEPRQSTVRNRGPEIGFRCVVPPK